LNVWEFVRIIIVIEDQKQFGWPISKLPANEGKSSIIIKKLIGRGANEVRDGDKSACYRVFACCINPENVRGRTILPSTTVFQCYLTLSLAANTSKNYDVWARTHGEGLVDFAYDILSSKEVGNSAIGNFEI
jgi:hypothetical protein